MEIDTHVRRLITDRDAQSLIRLRPQDELEQRGVIDPYLVAREFAALAHAFGREADRRQKSTPRRSAYTKQIKDDQDSIKLLRKPFAVSFDLLVDTDLPFPTRRPDHTEIIHCKEIITSAALQSSAELNREIRQLHQELRKIHAELSDFLELRVSENILKSASAPLRERAVYLIAFVEVMGHAWHLLTSREPSPSSGRFIDFAKAALVSIDYPIVDAKIDHAIREAVDEVTSRPSWDGFSRYSDGSNAPSFYELGTSFTEGRQVHLASDGTFRVLRADTPAWTGEMLRLARSRLDHLDLLLASSRSQGADAIAARIVLSSSYARGSESERQHLDERGWKIKPEPG